MSLLTVSTFLALLALLAAAGAIGVVLLALAGRWSESAADAYRSVRVTVSPIGLWLAFAVAGTSTAGSLYFSEIGRPGSVHSVLVPADRDVSVGAHHWHRRLAR